MAQRVTVEFVDDLEGTPVPEGEGTTVNFALGKKAYEIDLSQANQAKLEEALAPFIAAARSVSDAGSSSKPGAGRRSASASGRDLSTIRDWARSNGHKVNDRGRISVSVIEAYEAAN